MQAVLIMDWVDAWKEETPVLWAKKKGRQMDPPHSFSLYLCVGNPNTPFLAQSEKSPSPSGTDVVSPTMLFFLGREVNGQIVEVARKPSITNNTNKSVAKDYIKHLSRWWN